MRNFGSALIIVVLLVTPLRCNAQSTQPPSNTPNAAPVAPAEKNLPLVKVTLKDGRKLVGLSSGIKCAGDCRNCTLELTQNGSTQTIKQSDIKKIDCKRTFWQSIGHAARGVGIVVSAPIWFPLLWIACASGEC